MSQGSNNGAKAASAPALNTPSGSQPSNVQEFIIRVPKNQKKSHHVMRFNATLNVDFAQWRNVRLERENNLREFRGMDEEIPKFGAGSEYNRDLREEARRKKYGFMPRKYKPEAQPWILKVGGKAGKKFRGIREGGVGENAAFYVFTHAPDGAIEAYPLLEWYNFQPVHRYKALSAEEAEEEYGRRNKVMNYFQLMLRKRLKRDEDDGEDPEEVKLTTGKRGAKDLKISDMDEWMDSDEDSDSDSGDEEARAKKKKEQDSDEEAAKKKKAKKGVADKKKKKRDVDDEAFEESDDGDEEGREMDYISDSSDPESDPEAKANKEMKSVAEEDALRKLLTSDESSEEEKKSNGESEKEEEKKKETKEKEGKDKKKKKLKKKPKDEKKESLSDFSSDSSDSDSDAKPGKKKNGNSASNSRSGSPSLDSLSGKRKQQPSLPMDLGIGGNSNSGFGPSENSNSPTVTPAKKPKYEPSIPSSFAGVVSSKDDYGITEEAVRRYLMRKPMTTTELLSKFKNKKTGVSSEKLVETMTQILKRINPVKQTIQGKMYLSIKINK